MEQHDALATMNYNRGLRNRDAQVQMPCQPGPRPGWEHRTRGPPRQWLVICSRERAAQLSICPLSVHHDRLPRLFSVRDWPEGRWRHLGPRPWRWSCGDGICRSLGRLSRGACGSSESESSCSLRFCSSCWCGVQAP